MFLMAAAICRRGRDSGGYNDGSAGGFPGFCRQTKGKQSISDSDGSRVATGEVWLSRSRVPGKNMIETLWEITKYVGN